MLQTALCTVKTGLVFDQVTLYVCISFAQVKLTSPVFQTNTFANEPSHDKPTILKTCVTSKDSDQLVYPFSMARVSFISLWVARRL